MKRVKVSPGKFVTVSTAIAQKAARVFASGALTATQVRDMAASEPKLATGGVMLGKPKPGLRRTTVTDGGTIKHAGAGGVVIHGRDGRITSGTAAGSSGTVKRKAALGAARDRRLQASFIFSAEITHRFRL